MPFYFEESQDYLKKVDCSLYKRSWPSLFISPKGTVSDLHIDAFGSNFWMALLSGRKKWTFFQPKWTPFLSPRYFDTFDPVFQVDWQALKVDQFDVMEVTLTPGQVLFVPAGCPHRVENLEASVAVSGNIGNVTILHIAKANLFSTLQWMKATSRSACSISAATR